MFQVVYYLLQEKAKTERKKLMATFNKFIKARMDKNPNTNGTFFDSSKYEHIVAKIRKVGDMDTSTNYVPSKESQELMETEQN